MKLFLKCVMLLLLTLNNVNLYARLQGKAKTDSLLKELPNAKEDTNKVKLLQTLFWENIQIDPDEARKYSQQGVALATKLDWRRGIATGYNTTGLSYFYASDHARALEYYQKSINIFEELADKAGIALVSSNIGIIHADEGDHPKALEYFLKAVRLYEEAGNKQGIAGATGNVGIIYSKQKDYALALEYFLKALKLDEELGNKRNSATAFSNIGNVYCDGLKDYPKALEYFFKALALYEEIGEKGGIAHTTGNIGNAYLKQKNYIMALEYYESSLKIAEEIDAKDLVASNLCNIGALYYSIIVDTPSMETSGRGKFSDHTEHLAGKYLHPGYAGKSGASIPVGKAALLRGAIDHLERGLAIGKEINEIERIQLCYEGLAKAYKLNGEYKKALEASDNYRAIKDSVFSIDNKEEILKLGMKHEYDRQRLTDSLKAAEKERIGVIQLQKQKTFTYIGLSGILLLAGFSFFIVKERGKSEKERKKSDDLLLNILPSEVATELKANGTTTAKHFDNVTVLFTDFVNFTEAGERMSAQGLIDELHTCFKAFDVITSKYNIEKIKTIGDAYLAVAGLPAPDPGHAENIVKAALEINQYMQDRLAKLGNNTFEIRLGIHSGSVVAGIVGVKKFAYDIWGDTVNTAARMEQHSESGKVNLSQATYELVKDKFTCVYRGEINVKNKGVMKMYYAG